MQITEFLAQYTNTPLTTLLDPRDPLVTIQQDGEGNISFPVWKLQDIQRPSPAAIQAALVAAPPVASLAALLNLQAADVANAILNDIASDPVHLAAYQIAAAQVAGNGGQAPTTGSIGASFGQQAQAFSMTPAQFANVAIEVSAAAMSLSATLATLTNATSTVVANGGPVSGLNDALTAFEGSIGDLVTSLNSAGLTTTVPTPSPIKVVGLNA